MAFCQALINFHHQFTLNLSVGEDTFVFNNKELEMSSLKKKKKSPSQTRRREARLKELSCKDTEEESINIKLKPDNHVHKCNFCEMNFNSEKGLKVNSQLLKRNALLPNQSHQITSVSLTPRRLEMKHQSAHLQKTGWPVAGVENFGDQQLQEAKVGFMRKT